MKKLKREKITDENGLNVNKEVMREKKRESRKGKLLETVVCGEMILRKDIKCVGKMEREISIIR